MPNANPQNNTLKLWLIWTVIALIFLSFIVAVKSILLPFVIGMLAAYLLDPLADKLEAKKFSRVMATIVITVLFFVSVALGIVMIAPLLYHQIEALISDIPVYAQSLQQFYALKVAPLQQKLGGGVSASSPDIMSEIMKGFSNVLRDVGVGILKSSKAVIGIASVFVITPVVTFYLLRDWDTITAKFDALLPRKHHDVITEQMALIDQTLSGFIRGQLTVCTMLGTFYALALWVAGLKYAIMIGLLAGLLIIIPYVGTIFSGTLAIGLAYLQFEGNMSDVGVVAIIFIIGQIVEGNFLTPKIVGEKVGLHPVWLIFGMMAGGALIGFVGVLLAVPLTAILGVLIRFVIEQYKGSALYQGTA